jgi:2-amino-4-hydroxy-6-hydroxymethyldihydropteridine diphosphokinase
METSLTANELLDNIIGIETDMGRVRTEKWGPRLIDIDILLYGDQIVERDELHIPHPCFHLREFCLDPICEWNRICCIPFWKKTMKELKEALNNREES